MDNYIYYKNILGQILAGQQPVLEAFISDSLTENGHPDPLINVTYDNLENMPISVAVQFLEDNWEYFSTFYK